MYGLKVKVRHSDNEGEWLAIFISKKEKKKDNGSEYKSSEFLLYCKSRGILRQFSTPHTPQQNGVAERKNHTLLDAVRSMLLESGLSKPYWGEALLTATILQNRSPTKAID